MVEQVSLVVCQASELFIPAQSPVARAAQGSASAEFSPAQRDNPMSSATK